MTDPSSSQGALSVYNATSGTNVLVITYDLQADGVGDASPVQPLENLKNTAELDKYASEPSGPNYLSSPLTDTRTVTIAPPQTVKSVTTEITGPSNNTENQVVIGELATYTVTITVPQGVTNRAQLVDTLPVGEALVSSQSAVGSAGVSFSGSSSAIVSSNGRTLTFNLGQIQDADTNPTTPDTITLSYEVITLNVSSNVAGTTLNNSAVLSYVDGNGNSQSLSPAIATLNVVEPKITLNKTVAVNGVNGGSGDAGDPVKYTITLQHNDSTPNAYQVNLSDPLPTQGGQSLILAPTFTVTDTSGLVTNANFQLTGSDATGWVLSTLTVFDMPVISGRTITIVVTGTLASDLTPGEKISNTADTKFQDLPGNPSAVSPYDVTDSTTRVSDTKKTASFFVYQATPTKSLLATSEASTTGSNVTIGEVVRYRLVVRVPQTSTLPSVALQDLLPSGMAYLNDGTTMLAFVNPTSGGQILSDTLSGTGLEVSGNYTSPSQLSSITPTFVLPSSSINLGTSQPIFNLGDLNNTASDATNESFIVLDFNALVQNVAGNRDGTKLDNTFDVMSSGTQLPGSPSNTVEADVVEPKLAIAKTVVTPGSQAGDNVTYQVVLSNTGDATAFDIVLQDGSFSPTNPYLTNVHDVQVISFPSGTTVTPNTPALTELINQLAPGQSVTIQYDETLTQAVTPGLSVVNTARAEWTSLPGTNGTTSNSTGSATPGAAGTATGERTGVPGTASTIT